MNNQQVVVTDDDLPEIIDVQATPSSTSQGGNINITCVVDDNIEVESVNVSITGPGGFDPVNTTMNEGSYYYNRSYDIAGTYEYFIWANDTSGNANTSATYIFVVEDTTPPEITNVTDLSYRWNLIAIPFNQSVNKTDFIIRYNGSDYSWQEAVNNDIIVDFIYEWDRSTQKYEMVDTLSPGFGYWMYAYHDCKLLAKGISNFITDDFITDLLTYWNIVGLPHNKSLYKYNITIRYNGTDYSWYDATTDNNEEGEPLILGYIYGWDTDNQHYILSDVFTPKYGYWMYAYYNCSLKRNV